MAELVAVELQKPEEKQTITPEQAGQEELAKKVRKLLKQSSTATKKYREEWPENYRFVVEGKQWSIRRPRWRFSEVVNITWANIMTEVGIQTDGRPKVDYIATEASDFKFAEIIKDINDINWDKPLSTGFGWQRKLQSMIFQSKIKHVVHAFVGWDPKLEGGIGDIKFEPLDAYGCYWDPKATHIGESRYFIHLKPTPTAELRKKHPDLKDKIKPNLTTFNDHHSDGFVDVDTDRLFSSSGAHGQLSDNATDRANETDRFGGEEMTLLIQCWIREDEVIEDLVKDENGEALRDENGNEQFEQRLAYPKGRYLEVVNDVVLKDEGRDGQADPQDPHIFEDGLFPIVTLVNYDYGEYVGENEVTHMRGPQKLTNYVLSHIMDQFKMNSNPKVVIAERAQHIKKKITNEPGQKITVPEVGDVRFEPGTGVAAGSFNLLDTVKSFVDTVSGLFDVTKGAPQPGITSGLMLEGFVEASQTRPRLKNRSVDECLRQIGHLMASRILEFYRAPRVFRLTSKEGYPEFVTFFVEGDGEDRQATIQRTQIDEQGIPSKPQLQSMPAKGMPDVKALSGSNLPFARAQKNATALDLNSRGAITLESMLEAINWPNAKEEAQKALEEQQALAQGAPSA